MVELLGHEWIRFPRNLECSTRVHSSIIMILSAASAARLQRRRLIYELNGINVLIVWVTEVLTKVEDLLIFSGGSGVIYLQCQCHQWLQVRAVTMAMTMTIRLVPLPSLSANNTSNRSSNSYSDSLSPPSKMKKARKRWQIDAPSATVQYIVLIFNYFWVSYLYDASTQK